MRKKLIAPSLIIERPWCVDIEWEEGEEKSLSSFVDASMKYIIENWPQVNGGILLMFDDATVVYFEGDNWYYANLSHIRENQRLFYKLYMHYSELHVNAKLALSKKVSLL